MIVFICWMLPISIEIEQKQSYYQMEAGEGKITIFKWDKEDLKRKKNNKEQEM